MTKDLKSLNLTKQCQLNSVTESQVQSPLEVPYYAEFLFGLPYLKSFIAVTGKSFTSKGVVINFMLDLLSCMNDKDKQQVCGNVDCKNNHGWVLAPNSDLGL